MSSLFHFITFWPNAKTSEEARADSSPDPSSARTKSKNKLVSVLRKSISPENSFRKTESEIEAPPHCPNTWRAEPQKEKCPFHFRKKSPPRKSEKARNIFSFWCCRVKRGGGGAIRRAYEKLSHHTARGACTLPMLLSFHKF